MNIGLNERHPVCDLLIVLRYRANLHEEVGRTAPTIELRNRAFAAALELRLQQNLLQQGMSVEEVASRNVRSDAA